MENALQTGFVVLFIDNALQSDFYCICSLICCQEDIVIYLAGLQRVNVCSFCCRFLYLSFTLLVSQLGKFL